MDAKGIMSINDTATRQLAKDQRVLHQERAILLTADDSIAKFRNYQREREMAPILAQQRAADRQRAREERETKAAETKRAQETKAIEIAARKEAKAVEKRRWDALSPEDQRAETAAKRRRTRELKAAVNAPAIPAEKENEAPLAQLEVDEQNDGDIDDFDLGFDWDNM
jgi:hypothetical protein